MLTLRSYYIIASNATYVIVVKISLKFIFIYLFYDEIHVNSLRQINGCSIPFYSLIPIPYIVHTYI